MPAAKRAKPAAQAPVPEGDLDVALPSMGKVVGSGLMTVREHPEASDMRRLYVVRQTFNHHSIGDSLYLEPGEAAPLVAIALVEEVSDGPNPTGA
jgi:hypothetical protein